MRTRLFFIGLLFFASTAMGATGPIAKYYPADFVAAVDSGQRDQSLKQALFDVLSQVHVSKANAPDVVVRDCPTGATCRRHEALGYDPARKILFGELHLQQTPKGYAIFDVYCERLVGEQDARRDPPGPGLIPDNAILNTEHTWPQSHFSKRFPRELQKSDLHALFPVSSHANSSRGNLEFNDVVSETTSPCPASRRGFGKDGRSEQYFEPPSAHKGNVARAIFYFSIRYQMNVSAEEEASLKAWNQLDPVDDFERQRNEAIANKQGDRNPFIDFPELIDRISDF